MVRKEVSAGSPRKAQADEREGREREENQGDEADKEGQKREVRGFEGAATADRARGPADELLPEPGRRAACPDALPAADRARGEAFGGGDHGAELRGKIVGSGEQSAVREQRVESGVPDRRRALRGVPVALQQSAAREKSRSLSRSLFSSPSLRSAPST